MRRGYVMPDAVSFADLIDQLDSWKARGVRFELRNDGSFDFRHSSATDVDACMRFINENRTELKAYLIFKEEPRVRSSLEFHRWRRQQEMVNA